MTEEQLLRTREVVQAFLETHQAVSNRELQELAGISRQQASRFFARMLREGQLMRTGSGSATRYAAAAGTDVPSGSSGTSRPYATLAASLAVVDGDRTARMQAVVDTLWNALHLTGVSWVGFYLHEGGDDLVLGPRRDKPACSPIGLHGACGQAFTEGKSIVVRDVADLGEGYIACDPRDRSELVIPLFDESGACWGVLDLDSHATGSFDGADVDGLRQVLLASGLTHVDLPTN